MESSGDQHMDCQELFGMLAPFRVVHVIPSELVIMLLYAPTDVDAMAQNSDSSGDQVTVRQSLSNPLVLLVVHVIPSDDVTILLLTVSAATAQKSESSGDHTTDCQRLFGNPLPSCVVHVIPSGLVMIRLGSAVLVRPTAQNNDRSGDQQTDVHWLLFVLCVVQLVPSGLVMARSPVPLNATEHNRDISGAQHTENH